MKTHMTSAARLAVAILLAAVSLVLASCFYMPGVSGRAAKAGLSINRSLLPANVSSIAVIVGGPGMETIATQYDVGTTSATLSVPSGAARTFTVLASTPSVTFRDDVTVDLQPDETKQVDLTPKLAETQIIVPDYGNQCLVQISNMNGTGWKTLVDLSAGIQPYDVDFDDQGRIYIADYNRGILVTDDINTTPPVPLAGVSSTNILSIAMDRTHGLLYYLIGATLYKMQVEPTVDVETFVTNFESAQAVAVDSDGFIYVVSFLSSYTVDKINPNSGAVVRSSSYAFNSPWDVLVNGDFIYVSDNYAYNIVQLDKNLDFVDKFGGPSSDPFYGPKRFVAILNKPITVIDEGNGQDRLVSFGDMTGAGWTTYGSTGYSGSGATGVFQFYGY